MTRTPRGARPSPARNGNGNRSVADVREGLAGAPAKVDVRTKRLLTRIQPGEVAVIDHLDLDRLAAEGLIKAGAGAVVNASRSISGRYPNTGPLLVVAAGIPLIDDTGPSIMASIHEGQVLTVKDNEVLCDGHRVAKGTRHTLESLEAQIEESKLRVGAELERFAENTLEYLRREHHLLTDSPVLPKLGVDLTGRHVLVVVRGGLGWEEDLAALRAYVREMKPVLIGVDGGADALMDAGYRPDLIIGDFDSVRDDTLQAVTRAHSDRGAQLVVHAYPGGKAPGADRLESLSLPYTVFEAAGTSEDIAMLLAYEKRAELIVAVGTHASMVEFLDKGRAGMASTFLVRLKVGPILVDAKGVSRLYQSRVRKSDLAFLVGAALTAMLVTAIVAQPFHVFFRALWLYLSDTWRALFGWPALINLRYHIVSLVAVFLALTLGIIMGSTVIDRAIVDGLRDRVDSVSRRADRTDGENRNLRTQLDIMQGFADEARDHLVGGQLRGVPVLVVTVQGVDRKPVEGLREALAAAEAVPAGTLLLTNKLRLDNDNDVRALASAMSSNQGVADAIRRQALTRLAGALDGSNGEGNLIPALAAAGFVGYEPPAAASTTTTLGLSSFPVAGLRFVVVSGAGAEAGDDRVALPFTQALVAQASQQGLVTSRVVAAESGQDTPGGRAAFVGPLRADGSISARLSTVDHMESPMGQAAVVLALGDLSDARAGHFGIGPGAQRLLPSIEP